MLEKFMSCAIYQSSLSLVIVLLKKLESLHLLNSISWISWKILTKGIFGALETSLLFKQMAMLRRMVEANTKKKVLWMRGKRRSLKRRIQNCIQYFVVGRLHKELL